MNCLVTAAWTALSRSAACSSRSGAALTSTFRSQPSPSSPSPSFSTSTSPPPQQPSEAELEAMLRRALPGSKDVSVKDTSVSILLKIRGGEREGERQAFSPCRNAVALLPTLEPPRFLSSFSFSFSLSLSLSLSLFLSCHQNNDDINEHREAAAPCTRSPSRPPSSKGSRKSSSTSSSRRRCP